MTAVIAGIAALTSLFWHPRPLLLWNATPSSIVGLYSLSGTGARRTGDMVVAWAPPPARRLAAARRYLPLNVPLVKHVAAVAGDRVCAAGNRLLVNGRLVAVRRRRDPAGRTMPSWSGCVRLGGGELFLLSPGAPLAFDGRYFGISRASQVIGTARLLWAKPVNGPAHG